MTSSPVLRRLRDRAAALALLATLASLASCGGGRSAADALLGRQPASPHERYAESLRDAGLDDAALGRDWLAAADRALAAPLPATLPYREEGYFSPTEPSAVALRVQPRRGQRLSIRLDRARNATPYALFVDLFELPPSADASGGVAGAPPAAPAPPAPPRLVASADSVGGTIELDVSDDGVAYVVRLQPELLRGGRYTLTIAAGPSLAFPVAGKSHAAVQSFFGAGRDAGRRRHEGVDIFAARGTPVVAAGDGIVTRTGSTDLGGRVVWVRDLARGQSLYYAHLDSQIAHPGQRVRAGDTLGLVGNTGNARTTPPHLHFGIYRRGEGAVDPFPFIDTRRPDLPRLTADTAALGALRRVAARAGAPLTRSLPRATSAPRPALLPSETALRVEGASGSLYRVRLPDGSGGFLAARLTSSDPRSLASTLAGRPPRARAILEHPAAGAGVIDSVPVAEARSTLVIGRWEEFLLVRSERGRLGWVAGDSPAAGRSE